MSEDSLTDFITLDSNRELMEDIVLRFAMTDARFMKEMGEVICKTEGIRLLERDFRKPEDNLAFLACRSYWRLYGKAPNPPPVPSVVTPLLNYLVAQGEASETDCDAARKRLFMLVLRPASDFDCYAPVIRHACGVWLKSIRTAKVLSRAANLGDSTSEVLNRLETMNTEVSRASSDTPTFKLGDGRLTTYNGVRRIPSPWRLLNESLGGGFGRQEAALFVCQQAGGKTLTGCQIAGYAARMGFNVLFITAEETAEEIEPRFFSNLADIRMDVLGSSMWQAYKQLLSPAEKERVDSVQELFKERLTLIEWESGKSLKQFLAPTVEQIELTRGSFDLIVFDWIGHGLGELSKAENALRMNYLEAGRALAGYAREKDKACVSFAQANMKLAHNKKNVDATMIAECKQLTEAFSVGIGISKLYRSDDAAHEDNVQEEQWFHTFKSRKSRGRNLKVKRQFDFQRFVEVDNQK